MDELALLQGLGLELPSPAYIFGALLFGLIGLVAFRRGRHGGQRPTMWLGVALMLYPYLVPQTGMLYLVGTLLCGALWWVAGRP